MGRRRRRKYGRRNYDSFSRRSRHYQRRRRHGWGLNMYRNPREGKIGGVCAGLADYWDVAPWVVRLGWIGAFLFTGTLAFWAYIAAWILMAPRPTRRIDEGLDDGLDEELDYEPVEVEMEYDERRHHYRPRRVFRYSESSSVRLQRARERLDAAVRRVEGMESYVTSRQYQLNKEFAKL